MCKRARGPIGIEHSMKYHAVISFLLKPARIFLKRYACLVCKHRPTFDTITTLSIHCDGQKHIVGEVSGGG